jgi:hypothetical protein
MLKIKNKMVQINIYFSLSEKIQGYVIIWQVLNQNLWNKIFVCE